MLQLAEVFKLEFLCDPLFQSAKVGQSRCALETSDTLLKIALHVSYAQNHHMRTAQGLNFKQQAMMYMDLRDKHGYFRSSKTIQH